MRKAVKVGLLILGRAVGLFALARRLTANRLRIVCYHGVALGDEYVFRGTLFMSPRTLGQRLDVLARDYPVLPLGEAVERLYRGDLPPCATALTMDDGWYNAWREGLPLFRRLRLPLTVYVASHNMLEQTPVFDVMAAYMIWRSPVRELDLAAVGVPEGGRHALPARSAEAVAALSAHAHGLPRQAVLDLMAALGRALDVDAETLLAERRFHLMTPEEVTASVRDGFDIQLHSHSHDLPVDDPARVATEIEENRRALEPLTGRPLEHLCYPSGVHDGVIIDTVRRLGLRSATTVERGLNDARTDPLRLRRILDGEHLHPVEFEAEMAGLGDLTRELARRFGLRPGAGTVER